MTSADEWDDLFLEWGQDANGDPLPCQVETLQRRGTAGDKFADSIDLPGLPQIAGERIIRSSGGNERLSTARIYASRDQAAHFTPGSRVVLASGRRTVVIDVTVPDVRDLFAFVKVNLE